MARPRALIIGGAGYFGARLAEDLATTHDVVVTYRSLPPLRHRWLEDRGLKSFHYDASTTHSLEIEDPIDLLVNLAMPGAREAARNKDGALALARRTAELCASLVLSGQVCRQIHLSTFHVYGGSESRAYAEAGPVKPLNPYGLIHCEVEKLLQASAGAHSIYILRATNLIGAPAHLDLGDQSRLVFLDLCRQAAQHGRLVLGNDGASYRDMLPFADAIDAVRRLAHDVATPYRLFNLAAGQAMNLRSLAETIAGGVPGEVEVSYGIATDAYRNRFEVDVSRLRGLGWKPELDLYKEVTATLDKFR